VVTSAIALLAASCGRGDKTTATVTVTTLATPSTTRNPTGTATPAVTTRGRYHYPPELTTAYMRSCVGGDEKKQEYCACTLDKLSNDVSTGDFARIGQAGGRLPPRIKGLITNAAGACLDKL
jgi:hypothetical protein